MGTATADTAGDIWTEDRVNRLKIYVSEWLSAGQIAVKLEIASRNSVIGKIHRLGLSKRVRVRRKKSPGNPSNGGLVTNNPAGAPARSVLANAPCFPIPRTPLIADVGEKQASTRSGVALLDLKETMCRWPVGDPRDPDFHFCGAKRADGLPYCEKHARIGYQSVRQRYLAQAAAAATASKST